MDNYEKNARLVEEAVEQKCAFLQPDPFLAQRVLNAANEKGEMKVRKKISVGFVLVLVIMMMTAVTALAVGLTSYFSGFAALENEYGEYEQWPGSAKVQLVELMLESGVLTAEDMPQWTDDLTEEVKIAAAEAVIEAYFGNDNHSNTYTIMIHELGQFEIWPLAEKAYYSSLLIQYGKQDASWPVYLMPEVGDMQESEAIAEAKNVIVEKFGWDISLDDWDATTSFFKDPIEPDSEPYWSINLYPNGYDPFVYPYRVELTRTGEVLSYSAPGVKSYLMNDSLEVLLNGASPAKPGPSDITEEQAISIAKSSLTELGNLPQPANEVLDYEAHFFYHEDFNLGHEPVWLVIASQNDTPIQKVLLAYNGDFIDTCGVDESFDRTEHNAYPFGVSFFDFDFLGMTLEEKVAFSEEWNPRVEAYIKENPYYPNYNGMFYQVTRHTYGVPDDDVLSQDEASRIAQETLLELGARSETMGNRRKVFTYDITDPEKPIWKVLVYHVSFELMPDDASKEDGQSYQVIIDAKSGQVIEIYDMFQEGFDGFNI